MIQAYEEPMAFTRNHTLHPVLVLSSKYPCNSKMILTCKYIYIHIQLTINQAYYHLTIVKVYKTNFPLEQDNNN